MDGFDDLLSPSKRALEDNPFENPFAQHRSSSPDPWASFTSQLEHNPFSTSEPTTTASPFEPEPPSPVSPTSADPLESAITPEPEHVPSPPRTPTQFTTSDLKENALEEIREPKPEPLSEPTPEPEDKSTPGLKPSTPQPETERTPVQETTSLPTTDPVSSPASKGFVAFTPTHSPRESESPSKPLSAVVSPLDRPGLGGFGDAFSSMPSLGGDALSGGWESQSSSMFVNNASLESSREPSIPDDDEEDNRPVAQSPILKAKEKEKEALSNAFKNPPLDKNTGLQPVFSITVDDPQKVGSPISSYTMYTVHTRTTSPLFSRSAFSVLRRYSDFLWLYETLSANNPGVVVPPVPEKNTFGRFDDQFVQQRRLALERCIHKTANHPVLQKDPDLKLFLESDTFSLDIKHRKAEISHERGGLMASLGQSIVGPRFYETDEWFDRQKVYLDSLESQLKGLVKTIDSVMKARMEVAAATGEFSQALYDLASSDLGEPLSHSLNGLAGVESKAQEFLRIQTEQDMVTLMSTADEYARLVNSVRLAFTSRIRTYHTWQNCDADVRRAKQNHEKGRAQGRANSHSLSVVAEAERRALDAKQEFDQASRLVKTELARFEQERVEDFRDSLQAFLSGMIDRQKELLATWESYQQALLKKANPQTLQPQSPPQPHAETSSVNGSSSEESG